MVRFSALHSLACIWDARSISSSMAWRHRVNLAFLDILECVTLHTETGMSFIWGNRDQMMFLWGEGRHSISSQSWRGTQRLKCKTLSRDVELSSWVPLQIRLQRQASAYSHQCCPSSRWVQWNALSLNLPFLFPQTTKLREQWEQAWAGVSRFI